MAALAVQLGLYISMLQAPLRSRDIQQARPAVTRWVKAVLVWQLVVVGAAAIYVAAKASSHTPGALWIAPAVGAVFGTALPLQVAVVAIMRAAKR